MNKSFTQVLPGYYQYTYPTFVDTPQYICIHFLAPDGQQAFVSYPHHRGRKAAKWIPINWFQSVVLSQLEGHPQLMDFLAIILAGWPTNQYVKIHSDDQLLDELEEYINSHLLRLVDA